MGTYIRLVDYNSQQAKEDAFLSCEKRYTADQENFAKIPGTPIVYWVNEKMLSAFTKGEILKKKGDTRQGMATSDNNRFLRYWYEVSFARVGLNCKSKEDAIETAKKWFPYNKGGSFRKWYGNIEYIINYKNNGEEVKQYATDLYRSPTRTIKSISEYFKDCLSWSKVCGASISFRYYPYGFIFDVAGCCIFFNDDKYKFYDCAFLNSVICKSILSAISPTLNYEAGHIASLPIIFKSEHSKDIESIVEKSIDVSKMDWNSFETSWDFIKHPLV